MLVKRSGWYAVGDGKVYYENNELLICEWREIGRQYFYFDEHGRACRGWAGICGHWYFFSQSERAQAMNGHRYPEFALYRDTFIQDDDLDENNNPILYYVDSEGRMVHGLYQTNGSTYYFAKKETQNRMTGGPQSSAGHRTVQYLEGMMYRDDWFHDLLNGKLYYFSRSGRMVRNQTLVIRGVKFKFDAKGNATSGGSRSESPKTGWELMDDQYFWLEKGVVQRSQWKLREDKAYYLQEDGSCADEWTAIDGQTYFFSGTTYDHPASLVRSLFIPFGKGPDLHSKPLRYVREDGSMARGLTDIGGKKYYFAEAPYHCAYSGRVYEDGEMYKNEWFQLPESSALYYFKEDGAMARNETLTLFSVEYHFDAEGVNHSYAYKRKRCD